MYIADTSFLIAYINKADSSHKRAYKDMSHISSSRDHILINNLVFLELLTLANTRFRKYPTMLKFCKSITSKEENTISIHTITKKHFDETRDIIFDKDAPNLSFVDVSLILLSKQYKSSKLITYAKSLNKYAKSEGIEIS